MIIERERLEQLGTDLTPWEIGPYHPALPAPMRLRLMLDGEVIVAGEVERGYLHRGLEKAIESHPWQSAIPYADRLDPEASLFGELALCLAIEEICGLEVPPRAKNVRVILSELTRISAHLAFVARIARTVGAETMVHYVLRDRERVLDLFELLTGARFTLSFLRFGGVRDDVTEGFIERVLEACELLRMRLKEYNDLFTFNHAFLHRTRGVGWISAEDVAKFGITGPNARASGVQFDVRRAHPYTGFGEADFEVQWIRSAQGGGDAHDRFLVRLREIGQSLEILKQKAEAVPPGEFLTLKVGRDFAPPAGEAYARIESARGMLGCYVVSDGSPTPARVQFNPPSVAHLAAIPALIRGVRIEDLPTVLASIDPGIAEADR